MMKKFNTDKCESQTDSDQNTLSSGFGSSKSDLVDSSDGVVSPKWQTSRMLLPIVAIFLVFGLVRVFNVSSPESAVSEPIRLIEQIAVDVNHSDSNDQFNWQIPEMYPNKLSDQK